MSVNKIILVGRLGKDPELKKTDGGLEICKMSLATSERRKDKSTGEYNEETTWHNVTVFGKTAEHCNKYLVKGSQAFVEGKISHRSYEQEGVTKYYTEVIGDKVTFLGGKSDSVPSAVVAPKVDANFAADSIPF